METRHAMKKKNKMFSKIPGVDFYRGRMTEGEGTLILLVPGIHLDSYQINLNTCEINWRSEN